MAFAVRLFPRKLSTSIACEMKNVTVIGGGLMGSGIAQIAATSGFNVTLVEINDHLIEDSKKSIKSSLGRVARKLHKDDDEAQLKFVQDTMKNITGNSNLKKSVIKADIVIEAIIEDIKAKHKLFATIDDVAPVGTIFASNTSSLSISEIASVTKRPDRFGGLHFFNPVPIMKLLEVVRTSKTSDETYNKMMAFGSAIGKTCITCKDNPGFVVNRLLVPYMGEAVRMLERGDASAKDIDLAMKLGAGYPMGPLELSDYVGLDTTLLILTGWHKKFPDNPLFTPIDLLKKLVADGKYGVKSGEGFYNYKKK